MRARAAAPAPTAAVALLVCVSAIVACVHVSALPPAGLSATVYSNPSASPVTFTAPNPVLFGTVELHVCGGGGGGAHNRSRGGAGACIVHTLTDVTNSEVFQIYVGGGAARTGSASGTAGGVGYGTGGQGGTALIGGSGAGGGP